MLEEIGHRLSQASPSPETLTGILDLIASRTERTHMSIYLADGTLLALEAATGYGWATPKLELTGLISAVIHARHARMVPNQSAGRTSTGVGLSEELCLPLLEGAKPLGLLLVGSPDDHPVVRSEHPFFEAVADRLAAALTQGRDRARPGGTPAALPEIEHVCRNTRLVDRCRQPSGVARERGSDACARRPGQDLRAHPGPRHLDGPVGVWRVLLDRWHGRRTRRFGVGRCQGSTPEVIVGRVESTLGWQRDDLSHLAGGRSRWSAASGTSGCAVRTHRSGGCLSDG